MTSHPINLPLSPQRWDVVHVIGYGVASVVLTAYIAVHGKRVLYTPKGLLGELRDDKSIAKLVAQLAGLPLRYRLRTLLHDSLAVPETPRLYKRAVLRLATLAAIASPVYTRARNSLHIYYAVCPPGIPLDNVKHVYSCRCSRGARLAYEQLRGCSCVETGACVSPGEAITVYDPPRDLYIVPREERMLTSVLDVVGELLGV